MLHRHEAALQKYASSELIKNTIRTARNLYLTPLLKLFDEKGVKCK